MRRACSVVAGECINCLDKSKFGGQGAPPPARLASASCWLDPARCICLPAQAPASHLLGRGGYDVVSSSRWRVRATP